MRARSRAVWLVVAVCVLGVVTTAAAALTASRVHESTERRLLEIRTEQAASVLKAAVAAIEEPLRTAVTVNHTLDGGPRGARIAARLLGEDVGRDRTFVSAQLWRVRPGAGGADAGVFATLGAPTILRPDEPAMREVLGDAWSRDTTVVRRLEVGDRLRIGYAFADRAARLVVYTERAIPADRRAPIDRDVAYAGLDYAIYLGEEPRTEAMTTTNVDPAELPLAGDITYRTTVPFGDQVLTLATSARDHLGSPLSRRLGLLLLLGGLLLTSAAALVAAALTRARTTAEADTRTIRDLYERVDSLYADQRELFVALQRALLPHAAPDLPGMEVAAEYVAGATGIDIGGDWYSVVQLDDDRFAFVVGDVSGHGIEAVAEMARARFTIRAYLVEGHDPRTALERCSRQFDVLEDGHIVTVLVGTADRRTGEVTVVSAGHPPPLLVTGTTTSFVPVAAGPPLGLGTESYEPTSFTVPPGATLLCYTDGLVERRGEAVDTGLQRLADTVAPLVDRPLPDLIARTLEAMRGDGAADDTAVLALRRRAD
ncbi:PP2C family protein-serine/threonine phosphatase [Nocardioides sp. SYSU DS0663]|uniref:PP2C family protein-serine/threonine phosphatase n=1 Tax=Nocardioides sp. SYSU DS0663 TaxID=3416445 RepID=UPI003F4C4CD2